METTNRTTISEPVRIECLKFRDYLLGHMGRQLPDILWHYTGFDGLINILKSRQIWSTQHSCLNDSLEYLHLPRLIHEEVERRLPSASDPALKVFYGAADRSLSTIDISATGHFVSCFSEDKDDLGQWRGYGGGVCGYAIGFEAQAISDLMERRPDTLLLPMQYDAEVHDRLVLEIVSFAETTFLAGLDRVGPAGAEQWGIEFQAELADALDVVVSLVKHPKFKFENERRIATKLLTGEH